MSYEALDEKLSAADSRSLAILLADSVEVALRVVRRLDSEFDGRWAEYEADAMLSALWRAAWSAQEDLAAAEVARADQWLSSYVVDEEDAADLEDRSALLGLAAGVVLTASDEDLDSLERTTGAALLVTEIHQHLDSLVDIPAPPSLATELTPMEEYCLQRQVKVLSLASLRPTAVDEIRALTSAGSEFIVDQIGRWLSDGRL
jgi:hypothetical protein